MISKYIVFSFLFNSNQWVDLNFWVSYTGTMSVSISVISESNTNSLNSRATSVNSSSNSYHLSSFSKILILYHYINTSKFSILSKRSSLI